MNRTLTLIPALIALTACAAETQIGDFLARQPDPNIVFTDDFESGLGKWNQVLGTWITAAPGSPGLALKSPTSATATTFTITTLDTIDLSGKNSCVLSYEMAFNLTGATGVSAQLQFAGQTISAWKESTGSNSPNSSSQYINYKVQLLATSGKLALITTLGTGTTADMRLDNVRIRCGEAFGPAVTLASENFESGSANWTLGGSWGLAAGVGQGGSAGLRFNCINCDSTTYSSYTPTFSLFNRSGCRIRYYYDMTGNNNGVQNSLSLMLNGSVYVVHTLVGSSGTGDYALTAYEGQAGNQFGFRGIEGGSVTNNVSIVDNITVTCQQ